MADDMASMGNAFRAKSVGVKRSGAAGPKPVGATLDVRSPNMLEQIPGASTPQAVGAPQAIGDGAGHMGDWADRVHPVPQP